MATFSKDQLSGLTYEGQSFFAPKNKQVSDLTLTLKTSIGNPFGNFIHSHASRNYKNSDIYSIIAFSTTNFGSGEGEGEGTPAEVYYSTNAGNDWSASTNLTGLLYNGGTTSQVRLRSFQDIVVAYQTNPVANHGTVFITTNMVNWTTRTALGGQNINSIDVIEDPSSPSKVRWFVGNGVSVNWSTDAINWTTYTPGTVSWSGISNDIDPGKNKNFIYGNGKYLRRSNGQLQFSISTDLVNWVVTTSSPTNADNVNGFLDFMNGLFFYILGESTFGVASYSTNGINWTTITGGETQICKMGVLTYANGIYWTTSTGLGSISNSTNLINWTVRSTGYNDLARILDFTTTTSRVLGFGQDYTPSNALVIAPIDNSKIHWNTDASTTGHEVWLYANNTASTSQMLTLHFGDFKNSDEILINLDADSGLVPVIPGLMLRNGSDNKLKAVTAAATSASAVNLFGYVNKIGD